MARLGILAVFIFVTVIAGTIAFPQKHLSVAFLDVGQGDAIFIQGPTGIQILIDGGATREVLRQLGTQFPFYDRSIDVIIATHPDQDHIGGLREVIDRYTVSYFFESGVKSGSSAEEALNRALDNKKITPLLARKGMRMLMGGGAYIDVLFPDRDVSGLETNTASVMVKVVYGDIEFMLTGDSPQSIEQFLVSTIGRGLESDVLKAGHHGSKTSSSLAFVTAVQPAYVVVSAGKDNKYGHPHQEVVARIKETGALLFATYEEGTITFFSDGQRIWR